MILVDTSVWSLALRRDAALPVAETQRLREALAVGEVVTTGLILQELLQGFHGPRARSQIETRFSALPLLVPDRVDHSGFHARRAASAASGLDPAKQKEPENPDQMTGIHVPSRLTPTRTSCLSRAPGIRGGAGNLSPGGLSSALGG